ncbi:MAG: D-TA family PLP-dependent enzyme [Verrucomicrobia bacterium]|nr:D-TA family PLP-dependent enzyme [Verrucomicrobiota bacterium]
MIAIAGSPARLRPHMKTHKLPEVIRLQLDTGVTKFKCATIAEAEMVAQCGAPDVMLAYPPLGPNVRRLIQLARQYPRTRFSAIADDEGVLRKLSEMFHVAGLVLEVLLDLDPGMHRTGVEPGPRAFELYQLICKLPGLRADGLHVYDGHLAMSDLAERTAKCDAIFDAVKNFKQQLEAVGLPVPRVVAGGTPTFPIHAKRDWVECSPGTLVFWDAGYGTKLPDMDFLHAALVLTRVVSRPGVNRLCLDLGHKAIAAENPHPRVMLLGLEDAKAVMHSEEHLVVETPRANEFAVGTPVYGIPWHICPTVALHSQAVVVRNGRAEAKWQVVARERVLTV